MILALQVQPNEANKLSWRYLDTPDTSTCLSQAHLATQVGSRRPHRAPKTLQDDPRLAQDGIKMVQDGSKMPQDRLILAQDGLKMAPRM